MVFCDFYYRSRILSTFDIIGNMDTGKPKRLRVALTKEMAGEVTHETGSNGGPTLPTIGAKPDVLTQNITLMELLSQLNFRRKKPVIESASGDKTK